MAPCSAHGIAIDLTFDGVMNSLAVVALSIELHRDRTAVRLERRPGQIERSHSRMNGPAQVGILPPQIETDPFPPFRIGTVVPRPGAAGRSRSTLGSHGLRLGRACCDQQHYNGEAN